MPDKLRWGILGTGMIAKKFAADLPMSKTGELLSIGSRNPDSARAFAQESGAESATDYESVLQHQDVDAVYLALPNGLHEPWAIRALETGKHVLCEKPIARNHPEALRMFETAERCGRVLIEGFMYRTLPTIDTLIQRVREGEIGDLRLIRSNFTFERAVSPGDARYDACQGGGSLMDVGCYCVHFIRALTGQEPTQMSAIAKLHESGVDEYAAGLLGFASGTLATFTCGMSVKSNPTTFIAGTKGQIQIDAFWFSKEGFQITRGTDTEVCQFPDSQPPYAAEADAFAEAVDGRAPWISKVDSLANMKVLDGLRRSAGVQF